MEFNTQDIPGEEDVRRNAEAHLVNKARTDAAFRQALIQNPRSAIGKEFGIDLPTDFDVKVLQEDSRSLYLVLPATSEKDELSDQLLEAVAGGCDKGTAVKEPPKPPISSAARETSGLE